MLIARYMKEAGQHGDLLDCQHDLVCALDGPRIAEHFGDDLGEIQARARRALVLEGRSVDLFDDKWWPTLDVSQANSRLLGEPLYLHGGFVSLV
jgi:hypothetical protein